MAGTFVDRVERFYQQRIETTSRKARLVVALFVIYGLLIVSPFITFYHTNIYGLQALDAQTVLELGDINSSASLFDLPLNTVVSSLETHPLIEQAYWSFGMDGLSLYVQERHVVAYYCESVCNNGEGRYYAKGFQAGYVQYVPSAPVNVPTVYPGVWNDALASSLHALSLTQLALIAEIHPALATPTFAHDVRVILEGTTLSIYVSLGDLAKLMTVSSVILEEINTLDLASNLICATNSDNELVCVETSFTN